MSGNIALADLLFWALAALMTGGAVVLLFATRTWLSPEEEAQERGRGGHDLTVYRDQLSELEADVAHGVLTEAQALSTRLEVERRLLAADRKQSRTPKTAASSPGPRRRGTVALMVFVPVTALGLYLLLGSPGLPGQPFDSRGEAGREAGMVGGVSAEDMALMVEKLAGRLETEPENLEGWRMLARSYLALERPAEARAALQRGLEYFPRDPDLILTLARLEIMQAREETSSRSGPDTPLSETMPFIPPEAVRLLERLLAVEPKHGEALWILGLAEAQAGNRVRAAELWRRLLAVMPKEESENRAALEAYIQALEKTP